MSNRVVHFEVHVEDIERAKKFYGEVFDWKFQGWPMGEETYWAIMTAEKDSKEPGINGGFVTRTMPLANIKQGMSAYVCTIQVENFDEITKKIEAAGGKVDVPKFPLPGMAWQGYFLDTEGNLFGIHQADPNAK